MRNLFFLRQNSLCSAEVYDNIFALEALYDTSYDFSFAVFKFRINLLTLGFPDVLNQILLGCLRGNSTHRGSVELNQNLVAQFGLWVVTLLSSYEVNFRVWIGGRCYDAFNLEQLNFAQTGIEARFKTMVRSESPLRCRQHHVFDRLDDDRLLDPFLPLYLVNHAVEVLHCASTSFR